MHINVGQLGPLDMEWDSYYKHTSVDDSIFYLSGLSPAVIFMTNKLQQTKNNVSISADFLQMCLSLHLENIQNIFKTTNKQACANNQLINDFPQLRQHDTITATFLVTAN